MNKTTIIAEVAEAIEVTSEEAGDVVDAILDSIVEALKRGERVELRRFGTFLTRERSGRSTHIPNSERKVEVPPKRVPRFRPSRGLLELINRQDASVLASASEPEERMAAQAGRWSD